MCIRLGRVFLFGRLESTSKQGVWALWRRKAKYILQVLTVLVVPLIVQASLILVALTHVASISIKGCRFQLEPFRRRRVSVKTKAGFS
jgi:hypothetical protein